MREFKSDYFYGNEVSDYGKEHGYLDYATLAKAFNHVLANDLITLTDGTVGYWELRSGLNYDPDEERCVEVFQYFVVPEYGADIIAEFTDDPVWYNEDLDMYVWGVTHYGTSWDYVLTDVKINCGVEK